MPTAKADYGNISEVIVSLLCARNSVSANIFHYIFKKDESKARQIQYVLKDYCAVRIISGVVR